jgi:uncharacterized protein (DUF934 family)
MALIKNRAIVEDPFTYVRDDEPLPSSGDVIVSLARFRASRAELAGRRIGLRLPGETEPSEIAGELDAIAVIALEFAKFTDGRGYSTARLLRQRYGYKGEIRAVGYVLRDQLLYMSRCGFDAFEPAPGKDPVEALGAFDEMSVRYQPAADEPQPIWRRR